MSSLVSSRFTSASTPVAVSSVAAAGKAAAAGVCIAARGTRLKEARDWENVPLPARLHDPAHLVLDGRHALLWRMGRDDDKTMMTRAVGELLLLCLRGGGLRRDA